MAGPVLRWRVSQLRALALVDRELRRGAGALVSSRPAGSGEPRRGPGRQGPAAARGTTGAWRPGVVRPRGHEPGPAGDGVRRGARCWLPSPGDQGGLHEPGPPEGPRRRARDAAPARAAHREHAWRLRPHRRSARAGAAAAAGGRAPGRRRAVRRRCHGSRLRQSPEPPLRVGAAQRRGHFPSDSLRGRARGALAGTERRPAVSHDSGRSAVIPALEVRGLGYRLPEKGKRDSGNGRFLVRDVSFSVGAGETLVLLGRSGSGKTTTLKLINRLLEPTSGDVRVAGERAADLPVTRLRRRIGYVIQEVGLFPHFTVERNVGLVPRLDAWPPARIAARVRELLALVGLDPDTFVRRYPDELSGGQRQRVGVARALAADPPLLLLDEPFGALDPITRVELQREFAALEGRIGKAMVFVTHDVREGLLLGTHIGLMLQGRLAFLGTPDEFRRSDDPECRAFMAAA